MNTALKCQALIEQAVVTLSNAKKITVAIDKNAVSFVKRSNIKTFGRAHRLRTAPHFANSWLSTAGNSACMIVTTVTLDSSNIKVLQVNILPSSTIFSDIQSFKF